MACAEGHKRPSPPKGLTAGKSSTFYQRDGRRKIESQEQKKAQKKKKKKKKSLPLPCKGNAFGRRGKKEKVAAIT